jgi:hypothetical protein
MGDGKDYEGSKGTEQGFAWIIAARNLSISRRSVFGQIRVHSAKEDTSCL